MWLCEYFLLIISLFLCSLFKRLYLVLYGVLLHVSVLLSLIRNNVDCFLHNHIFCFVYIYGGKHCFWSQVSDSKYYKFWKKIVSIQIRKLYHFKKVNQISTVFKTSVILSEKVLLFWSVLAFILIVKKKAICCRQGMIRYVH